MTFKKGQKAWNKGKKMPEIAEKMRQINLGNKNAQGHTLPEKCKLTQFKKGHQNGLGRKLSMKSRELMRLKKLGKTHSEFTKNKLRDKMLGRTIYWKDKISESQRGNKSYNWKGGRDTLNKLIRSSFKYREWTLKCMSRDNFKCQQCGINNNELIVHHIKQFALILIECKITKIDEAFNCVELWDINNGVVLCNECHKKIERIIKN